MGVRFWQRVWWCRALALLVLVLGTPGVADVVQDVMACATGVECCADGACEEKAGAHCPRPCTHCSCCLHPGALPPVPAGVLLASPAVGAGASFWNPVSALPSGYRAPPFRPPVG